jgi:hypothetical protein
VLAMNRDVARAEVDAGRSRSGSPAA